MLEPFLTSLFAAQLCCLLFVYTKVLGKYEHATTHHANVYSQSTLEAHFDRIQVELERAKTSYIVAINANRIQQHIHEIERSYKHTLTQREREKLLYFKTQLSDILASDTDRDPRYLNDAVDGYEQLSHPDGEYREYAQQRLTELRSIPAYLKLVAARNGIKHRPLIQHGTGNPIAALVRCVTILRDKDAKPDVRREALTIIPIALRQLGLHTEAAREEQRLASVTPTHTNPSTLRKRRKAPQSI